jgi:hypothetical protein
LLATGDVIWAYLKSRFVRGHVAEPGPGHAKEELERGHGEEGPGLRSVALVVVLGVAAARQQRGELVVGLTEGEVLVAQVLAWPPRQPEGDYLQEQQRPWEQPSDP